MNKEKMLNTPIAFFDLDLTILNVNSATLWIRSEYKLGHISLWYVIQAMYWLTRYHLGSVSMESALLSAFESLKGQDAKAFNVRITDFYHAYVAHRVRKGALLTIEGHKKNGHLCYLCTNASAPLAQLFCTALDLDGMICNSFEEKDHILTGAPATRLCFGQGKLILAKELLEGHPLTLDQCYFYTDSYSDLSLLEAVGHPFVVHPDRRLRKLAEKNNWPILDWGH